MSRIWNVYVDVAWAGRGPTPGAHPLVGGNQLGLCKSQGAGVEDPREPSIEPQDES